MRRRSFVANASLLPAASLLPGAALARRPKGLQRPFRTLDDLAASLDRSGVPDAVSDALVKLAKPCAALPSKAAADPEIPVGASKMGGAPDLPPATSWPTRSPTSAADDELAALRDVNEEHQSDHFKEEIARKEALAAREAPLAFMLQLDLAACAATGPLDPDIPRTGRLLLFYDLVFRPSYGHDAEGRALFQVLHVPAGAMLERRAPPDLGFPLDEDDPALRNMLPPARLTPVFTWTLPDGSSPPIFGRYGGGKPVPHQRWLDKSPTHLDAVNRLGGWPENVQYDAVIDVAAHDAGMELPRGSAFLPAVKALEPRIAQWVLLLQVGDYDNTVEDFNGVYYVWIRRDHLRAGDFSQARMVYQTD